MEVVLPQEPTMPVMIDAHASTKHAVDLLLTKLQNKKFKVSTLRQFLFP